MVACVPVTHTHQYIQIGRTISTVCTQYQRQPATQSIHCLNIQTINKNVKDKCEFDLKAPLHGVCAAVCLFVFRFQRCAEGGQQHHNNHTNQLILKANACHRLWHIKWWRAGANTNTYERMAHKKKWLNILHARRWVCVCVCATHRCFFFIVATAYRRDGT